MSEHSSPTAQATIEISPPANIFVVEFTFEGRLGVSVILPATCALMAKLEAWRLFPEHKRRASATTVFHAQYIELDWQEDRFVVVKQRKRPAIPVTFADQLNKEIQKRKRGGEGAQ